jgi:hypothetical protein
MNQGLPRLAEFLIEECDYEFRTQDDTPSAMIRYVGDLKRRIAELEAELAERPEVDARLAGL